MAEDLRARLQAGLVPAMRARDQAAVAALRSALAALANAEAVPVERPDASRSEGPIAGAVVGAGAAEAPRRRLGSAEVRALVVTEVVERRAAAADLVARGRHEAAERLRAEADALAGYLDR